jgi:very-short-patch-repair endonuclease
VAKSDLELLFSLIWQDECRRHRQGDLEPEREYQFHDGRKWRLDFAWPVHKVGVEIDGGMWIKGGHNTGVGSHQDRNKANAAAALGWLVLRYDEQHLREVVAVDIYQQIIDAMSCIRGKKKAR